MSTHYDKLAAAFSDSDCIREANEIRRMLKSYKLDEMTPAIRAKTMLSLHEDLVSIRKRQLELAAQSRDARSLELQRIQLDAENKRAE